MMMWVCKRTVALAIILSTWFENSKWFAHKNFVLAPRVSATWHNSIILHIYPSFPFPSPTFKHSLHNSNMQCVWSCLYTGFIYLFFVWRCDPMCVMASSLFTFLDHTQRYTTVSRTPLDKWSARRRDLCLTTLKTDKHTCPQWDSNWSQQASGCRPMP
jgi:hypothetical protein